MSKAKGKQEGKMKSLASSTSTPVSLSSSDPLASSKDPLKKSKTIESKEKRKVLNDKAELKKMEQKGSFFYGFFQVSIILFSVLLGVKLGIKDKLSGISFKDRIDSISLLFQSVMDGNENGSENGKPPLPKSFKIQLYHNGRTTASEMITIEKFIYEKEETNERKKRKNLNYDILPFSIEEYVGSLQTIVSECQVPLSASPTNGWDSPGGICRLFDEFGREIKELDDLKENGRYFLVKPGYLFFWPTWEIGYKTIIPADAVSGDDPSKPIEIETLSAGHGKPRVFMLYNFLSDNEVDKILDSAFAKTSEGFRFERSKTGADSKDTNSVRTSSNAFDPDSPIAMKIKRRAFDLLGIHPYHDEWADGLQVLEYNTSQAYIPHYDYLENPHNKEVDPYDHNFNAYDVHNYGANRFATVFLYLSDVEEGGETVFIQGDRLEDHPYVGKEISPLEPIELVEKGIIKENSWQEDMVKNCRKKLAVKPKKGAAILFYTTTPSLHQEKNALHGGCPVLTGLKYAANVWVWNNNRFGYPKAERNTRNFTRQHQREGKKIKSEKQESQQNDEINNPSAQHIAAKFESEVNGVSLYYEDTFWSELGPNQEAIVNTFPGHIWNLRKTDSNKLLRQWTIKGQAGDRIKFKYSPQQKKEKLKQKEDSKRNKKRKRTRKGEGKGKEGGHRQRQTREEL